MRCEKCNNYILHYLNYSDFTVLCDSCKDKVIKEKEETLAEHYDKLIDRVSEGLTPIDDSEETQIEEDE